MSLILMCWVVFVFWNRCVCFGFDFGVIVFVDCVFIGFCFECGFIFGVFMFVIGFIVIDVMILVMVVLSIVCDFGSY